MLNTRKTIVQTVEKTFRCENAPMGRFGLEGYQRGDVYRAQEVVFSDGSKSFRVFPDGGDGSYYETMSACSKNKFFSEVTK